MIMEQQEFIGQSQAYFSVRELSKQYIGGYSGVNSVSFDLARGEQLTILGYSGSGKTTILDMISGLEDVTEGNILLDGQDITAAQIKSRGVGYLHKSLQLQLHKKVKDNIIYPLLIRKIDNNTMTERLNKLVQIAGISDILQCKVAMLSYYQKVLVALLRLAVCERKLYLIDDIFANLTPAQLSEICKILRQLFCDKTVIFAVSNYALAQKLPAKKVLLLGYGTAIGCGYIHDKEIFYKTLIGNKMYNNLSVCALPCKINEGCLSISNLTIPYPKRLVSPVFSDGILCFDSAAAINMNADLPKLNVEIGYINLDNIAYFDIDNCIGTIDVSAKKCKVGDTLTLSIDAASGVLYDLESERKIST